MCKKGRKKLFKVAVDLKRGIELCIKWLDVLLWIKLWCCLVLRKQISELFCLFHSYFLWFDRPIRWELLCLCGSCKRMSSAPGVVLKQSRVPGYTWVDISNLSTTLLYSAGINDHAPGWVTSLICSEKSKLSKESWTVFWQKTQGSTPFPI